VNFPNPFYRWRPHPWHGLEVGEQPPEIVNAFIEITPFDMIKYEVLNEVLHFHPHSMDLYPELSVVTEPESLLSVRISVMVILLIYVYSAKGPSIVQK